MKPKKSFAVALCDCGRRNQVVGIIDVYGAFQFLYGWKCQDCLKVLTVEMIEKK